jgi:phage gp16-like protein
MPKPDAQQARRTELAKIHMGAKQLGMDPADKNPNSAYRDMLWVIARVRSASDLDAYGRQKVIGHLAKCGATFKRPGRPTPAIGKEALVSKIRAQLAAAGRPDAYADGMARKMFTVDRFEWCTEDQLRRIVAALNYDAKRRESR